MSLPSNQRESARFTFEMPSALDAIDRRMVAELQQAPRVRVAELARRVGLSSPAVAERLRRLADSGVLSYRAEVDPLSPREHEVLRRRRATGDDQLPRRQS